MFHSEEASLLKIRICSSDKLRHTPLGEALIWAAHRYGLASATMTKETMGFGPDRKVYTPTRWEFSDHIPLSVEITDRPEKIESFLHTILPFLERLPTGALITIEKTLMIHLQAKKPGTFRFPKP